MALDIHDNVLEVGELVYVCARAGFGSNSKALRRGTITSFTGTGNMANIRLETGRDVRVRTNTSVVKPFPRAMYTQESDSES